jgi:hypothetical protein
MKTIFFAFFLLLSFISQAQHYYNDIVGAAALRDKMKDYTTNRVKSVTATGFDERGVKSSDFSEWQEVDAAASILKVTSRNGQQIVRQQYQFDRQFNITSLTETSGTIKSTTVYTYDGNNNIVSIKTTSTDSLNNFNETDEHQWSYNANGKPQRLLRILNGHDSSEYRLSTDEKGNVADEKLYRRNRVTDSVLYYYNDNNNLTDIVRFDKKAKKLLPDVMFEYDDNNHVTQRITVLATIPRPDYLIWRYLYDAKGLKTKEAMFGKMKQLKGRIEYVYSYNP